MEHTLPLTISIVCDRCGSGNVAIPEMPGSFDHVVCCDCGAELTTRAALDADMDREIKAQVTREFQRVLQEQRHPRQVLRLV